MSEPLRTHTERTRDQRRIEMLEAELALANRQNEVLAGAYMDALEMLARVEDWRTSAILAALAGGFLAILLLRVLTP